MNYILFDDQSWETLLPLTFTRPVSEIRVGILTIKEKWEKQLGASCFYLTQSYLQEKYRLAITVENVLINGSIVPNKELIAEIETLNLNEALVKGDVLVAVKLSDNQVEEFRSTNINAFRTKQVQSPFYKIEYPWDIYRLNGLILESDFKLITAGRKSANLSRTNRYKNKANIFIEEGAKVEFSILNASNGYIYIGRNAEIMDGSIVRGSLALCHHATIKMGAKIYGPTTIGPHSKVGGEVNNSVVFGYSNKGHDGFLGNSVLGEWCNIGADSNNSNLKNNYSEVRIWSYQKERFISTNSIFCGLIMADHSKCGINTMFNTGTVVGVSSNIFGSGFLRNFVPSFAWGGASGFSPFQPEKAFEVAERVMDRRNRVFDDIEKNILIEIFDRTRKYRKF